MELGRILETQIKPTKLVLPVLLATLVFSPNFGLDIRVASKTDNTGFINFIYVINILPGSKDRIDNRYLCNCANGVECELTGRVEDETSYGYESPYQHNCIGNFMSRYPTKIGQDLRICS